MRTTHTIIIGAGQAGLAMSRSLSERGVDHVVLERGRVGERWRSERWDSLRLLTPRWQSRLPGFRYEGDDPDGYMTRGEVVDYLATYARSFDAPVEEGVTVTSVSRDGDDFQVETNQGALRSRAVVIATGDCQVPRVPECAAKLSPGIQQVVPSEYRNPTALRPGGVLVVGASATGLQLAMEIHASGRPVTLSVGRHTRLPRTYRGRDILAWLDEMGILDESADDVHDLASSRRQPSLQLIGSPDRRTVDLSSAMNRGIRIVGRAVGIDGTRVDFDDNLVEDVTASDVKLARLRLRIDRHVLASGLEGVVPDPESFRMIDVPDAPTSIDLDASGIRTVLWATGYSRAYPWLHLPVLDEDGEVVHDGGVTREPGLYVMGLRFLRRRTSSFIDGQRLDAEELADHLVADHTPAAVPLATVR